MVLLCFYPYMFDDASLKKHWLFKSIVINVDCVPPSYIRQYNSSKWKMEKDFNFAAGIGRIVVIALRLIITAGSQF